MEMFGNKQEKAAGENGRSQLTMLIDIPQVFYSGEKNAPFSHCEICHANLLQHNCEYLIEKTLKSSGEIIMEYAICNDCKEKIISTLSENSILHVAVYFNKHVNVTYRTVRLFEEFNGSVDNWINKCVLKNIPLNECETYQLCCQCAGDKMVVSHLPMMISGEAITEMNEIISTETKEDLLQVRQIFKGLPPGLEEFIGSSTLIFG